MQEGSPDNNCNGCQIVAKLCQIFCAVLLHSRPHFNAKRLRWWWMFLCYFVWFHYFCGGVSFLQILLTVCKPSCVALHADTSPLKWIKPPSCIWSPFPGSCMCCNWLEHFLCLYKAWISFYQQHMNMSRSVCFVLHFKEFLYAFFECYTVKWMRHRVMYEYNALEKFQNVQVVSDKGCDYCNLL